MPKRQVKVRSAAEIDLVAGARHGDEAAVRVIVRQNNRRLFRVARAVVRDDGEAEDIVQEAYVRAFTRLGEFRGESSLSTWLTRIVINEAYGRLRRRRTTLDWTAVEATPAVEARSSRFHRRELDPERAMAQHEISSSSNAPSTRCPSLSRRAGGAAHRGDERRGDCRAVAIRPETVKTRLHRARELLRDHGTRSRPVVDRRLSVRRKPLRTHGRRRGRPAARRLNSRNLFHRTHPMAVQACGQAAVTGETS